MEFDNSRVYTALNADELAVGSTVFYADRIADLKDHVANDHHTGVVLENAGVLEKVLDESCVHRFLVHGCEWALAYLIEEPKKPRRMTNYELAKWLAQGNGQWRSAGTATIGISYNYGYDDREVVDGLMIRGWDETEWREPLVKED